MACAEGGRSAVIPVDSPTVAKAETTSKVRSMAGRSVIAGATRPEQVAGRSGLELQIDLDTSAGELARYSAQVEDWLRPVKLPGGEYPLSVLSLVRLSELSLHHVDLDVGFSYADLDVVPARWLLEWTMLLMDDPHLPAVALQSDSGITGSVGGTGERRLVTGPDAALWAWVTGRSAGEGLPGAEGLRFPLAG